MSKFKEQQVIVKQLVSDAKFGFEERIALNIKENPRAFFSYVRSKQKGKDAVVSLKEPHSDSIITDSQGIADLLNDYFVSVFTREDIRSLPKFQVGNGITELTSIIFSEGVVLKELLGLNVSKAPGPDALYPFLLKSYANYLCIPLALVFRNCLRDGFVPDDWKCANITPIFKKGDRSRPCNYRPVSLTSVVCKVMESIVKRAIVKHFDTYKLIRKTQHGFCQKRSCLTNILEFLEDVTSSMDRQKAVDVIFLDFQKAFDKVPHQHLLFKLCSLGINGNLLAWIQKWLCDLFCCRKQRVVVKGCASSWQNVTSGVPQGSVLGPLLFVAYINDLDANILSRVKKFADDTKLYAEISSHDSAVLFQNDLDKVFSWSQEWQMLFNVGKCKVMHIGNKNPMYSYNLDGENLQEVLIERDLGVFVDSSMKPSKQCIEAAKKGNRVLGMIRRNFRFLGKDIVLRLYKQLVRPHLEYAVQAWNPYFSKDKDILEKVQRRATRMISSLKGVPYDERLRILNLTTLDVRRVRGDLIQVFKIVHGFDNLEFCDFFKFALGRNTRGHCLKLQKVCCRLDVRKNFFSQRVVNEWNELPESVVLSNSVNGFKNALDKHFKQFSRI